MQRIDVANPYPAAGYQMRGNAPKAKIVEYVPRILTQLGNPNAKPLRGRVIDTKNFDMACANILDNNYGIPLKIFHGLLRSFGGPALLLRQFFDKTPEKNASGEGLRNEHFYLAFITKGKKGADFFSVARTAFREAKDRNLSDVGTYASYIVAAGKNGEFEEAKAAFQEAKERNLSDVVTYASYIDAAGKNGKFEEAQAAFQEAKERNLSNVVTYASYIDAAGKNGKFKEAKAAFQEAKDRNLSNVVTYNSYIDAAGKNGEFEESRSAFKEAKDRNLSNVVTYVTYIDCLYLSNEQTSGMELFCSMLLPNLQKKKKRGF